MRSLRNYLLQTTLVVSLSFTAFANQSWPTYVAELRKEALAEGIRPAIFDSAFADIHEPSRQVKGLSKSQPEHRITYQKYLSSRVDASRISVGRSQYKKNQDLANKIGRDYEIDPCFMMAFWGMETSYGSYMGNFPVIKSLATLAYDSKRQAFFHQELLLALHILNDGHVSLQDFKGEWAGASGQPQFLPSSWVKYAVDYDGDGHKDIWRSKPDVSALGVRRTDGSALPYPTLNASIVQPIGGPVFLAYPNYRMILRYNNSIYYAGAVGYLADKICSRTS